LMSMMGLATAVYTAERSNGCARTPAGRPFCRVRT
jgi:hypothetical protein